MTVRLTPARVTQVNPLRIVMDGDPQQVPIPALPKVYSGHVHDQVMVRALRSGRKPVVVAVVQAGA